MSAARVLAVGSLLLGIAAGVTLFVVADPLELDDGVNYADLRPGDCFEEPSGSFTEVTERACTDPHDLEAFAVLDHPAPRGAVYPGKDALVRHAATECLPLFQEYVGVASQYSTLKDVEIVPRADAWQKGNRRLLCAVGAGDNSRLTGSVRGSAR